MTQALTIAEIHSQFESEWILVGEPKTNALHELEQGNVIWHSKDRDEVYRKAVELRPKRFAIVFTGTIPENTAIVLFLARTTAHRGFFKRSDCFGVR
jgi:hypothetical protein